MNKIFTEKDYQSYIIDRLVQDNGYIKRDQKYFNRFYAIDQELLFNFLNDTQPTAMESLKKIYKDNLEETILNYITKEISKTRGSLIETLKNGIEIASNRLTLVYSKPATTFNEDLNKKYEQNIFSVMEEVWASDDERIDLVIFLNGFAIISFELKCNASGQSYENAIEQYKTQRNPDSRLFKFKVGCIVNFAMDLYEVYMTTKLNRKNTFFLPFNMGRGEGVDSGAGNPTHDDGRFSVAYMWEDILKKDTLISLLTKFIFIERKEENNELNNKKKRSENLIFPRYHQFDVIRKILDDVYVNGSTQNYLIQHSAGSGKTNSIAWLAHRLASFHDENNKVIFNTVIIVTDRIVVDRQLQDAIMGMDHAQGLIRVMDDKCTSADLANALNGHTKIIGTTIQKFPHILDKVRGLKNKTFAVIIDEAHSSTAGKDMAAITKSLSSTDADPNDIEDLLTQEIESYGKQVNVSFFAFTATPKHTTIQMFGRVNKNGDLAAFHLYSMKQAIEEGFILDVLKNYTTYDTFCNINKTILDDPLCKTSDAKRQIARFIELHPTNIAQRIEIIIEHFRTCVMQELEGKAKAMVVTSSREEAVKCYQALGQYIQRKGYNDIKALVAFSGTLRIKEEQKEYTESGINGFAEDRLPKEFDKDQYQVLLVANKYQTGFDQKKLCAMYILKTLKGVAAVQTLSRLNRICPPYDKKTFVLDFANSYDEIKEAFAPYYTATFLANSITPSAIREIEAKISAYQILDPDHIEKWNELLLKPKKNIEKFEFYINAAKTKIDDLEEKKRRDFISLLKRFVRFYELLIQVTSFENLELHKKYKFIDYLLAHLEINKSSPGYNLDGKLRAYNFEQKKNQEHTNPDLVADPIISLPIADGVSSADVNKKLLSEIIAEINSVTGMNLDPDVATEASLQIKTLLQKNPNVKNFAQNNNFQDFKLACSDIADDVISDVYNTDQDFFSLLLSNEEFKEKILNIFMEELYKSFGSDSDESAESNEN